jgi:hypothetical protein
MPTRLKVTDASVFTLGGSDFLGNLKEATIKMDAKTEDGSGQADAWEFTVPVKYKAEIEGTLFLSSVSLLVSLGDELALVYNTGGNTYSGNFVISSASHAMPHEGQQTQKVTFKNQGEPTIS